ncbi:hypothetical protein D3C72_2011680 [compost metagenome]
MHRVLPGESDSFATDWPLQRTSFMTMLSGVKPTSLVRLVPMPKPVMMRSAKCWYRANALSRSRPSENTRRLVLASMRRAA